MTTPRDALQRRLSAPVAPTIDARPQHPREVVVTTMTIAASAVWVAGAADGVLGSLWASILMTVGATFAVALAERPERKAVAHAAADSLGAVALYRAVRTEAEAKHARHEHANARETPGRHERVPLASAPPPFGGFQEGASPIATGGPEHRHRALSQEHHAALLRCERGDGGPTLARRKARRLVAEIERDVERFEASLASGDDDPRALLKAMRRRLAEARDHLRHARLVDEASEIAARDNASPSARRHAARCSASARPHRAWEEDATLLARAESLVTRAAEKLPHERQRGGLSRPLE